METSLMIYDYPEPEERTITRTIKVECSFTTYVTVEVDPRQSGEEQFDDIEAQINKMDRYDLLEEADKIRIEDFNY